MNALDRVWHGPDNGTTSDQYLISPVFTVNGPFTVQFDHSFSFEFDATGNFDGGVIEMAVNGGAFADIGAPAYNGTIVGGGTNPLRGRPGFVQTSGGTQHVSLSPAAATVGATVQIRFRVGTDGALGAPGWDVDDIAFGGVVETPFDTIVEDSGCRNLATATTLASSPNPSTFGATVTLTATVSGPGIVDTGTVVFMDGATPIGTAVVDDGVATLATASLGAGAHLLSAEFSGGGSYAPSISATLTQTVNKAETSLALASSQNPAAIGSAVTFTATVSSSVEATGTVIFRDGATELASRALVGGVATFTTSSLTGGTHAISAEYAGNENVTGSSASLVQEITTGSTIQLTAASVVARENGGSVVLTVTRAGGVTTGSAHVDFSTVDGTALAGVRYEAASGTVDFGPGETSKTITVALIDNIAIDGKATFSVSLSGAFAATLGDPATATVTILDDDARAGDFSPVADGKVDILIRNASNGNLVVWLMNGFSVASQVAVAQLGGNFKLAGVGDFNGDGHADLLWRNAVNGAMTIGYLNGTTPAGTASIDPMAGAFTVSSVGDLDGDGFVDIVWRNTSTGQLVVWLMRDTVRLRTVTIPTSNADRRWSVAGMGDFNRDGKLDIVWQNDLTGQARVWLMNGTSFVSSQNLPSLGILAKPTGVGDLNGDGHSDLVYQLAGTPQNVVFALNRTQLTTIVTLPRMPSASWSVVSPR